MDLGMAYLLGMYYGNGKLTRNSTETTIFIEVPYKTLVVDDREISVYVAASINQLKDILQPLLGTAIKSEEQKNKAIIYFTKKNEEYVMKEFIKYVNGTSACEYIELNEEIKAFTTDEKIQFLKGFADVTGYIRNSNAYIDGCHRVYLEIPHNWRLVVDIANLLMDVGVPIQNIDWAHPNMRDPKREKFDKGNIYFWKKEHQIKIWVQDFASIGFSMKHKEEKLKKCINCNRERYSEKTLNTKSKFYWEKKDRKDKIKARHPGENDTFIPEVIRGKHYDNWKEIARDLGYPPDFIIEEYNMKKNKE